jgi:hypothetical protein
MLLVSLVPVFAFDKGNYTTPDGWSQHVSPGQFKESFDGLKLTEESNLYLTLTSRFRLKSDDYAEDQDFYQYLRVHTDSVALGNGTVRFSAFARFADDIDGEQDNNWNSKQYYSQRDILDTELEDNDWAPRLYHGYAKFDGVVKNTVANLGRFYLEHLNTFQIDGADVTVKPHEMVEVYAFAGRPVSYYYDLDEDNLYGLGIALNYQERTKLSAEYVRLDVEDMDDDYTKAKFIQIIPNGTVMLGYTVLNDAATVDADLNYEIVKTGTIVSLEYEGLQDEIDNEKSYVVNPLTYTLLPESKYDKYGISAYQAFLDHFVVGLSYKTKAVDGEENFDNRDYSRISGKFDINGLPTPNTYISFSADKWNISSTDDNDDNDKVQYGLQLSQKINDITDIWFGTSFGRYEYDYINDKRKDSVRSYYIGGQVQPSEMLSFMADLSREDTEFYDGEADDLDKNYVVEFWANIIF